MKICTTILKCQGKKWQTVKHPFRTFANSNSYILTLKRFNIEKAQKFF